MNKFLEKVLQFKGMLSRAGVTPPYAFYVQETDEKDFARWLREVSKGCKMPISFRHKLPKEHLRDYPDAVMMVADVIICKKEIL